MRTGRRTCPSGGRGPSDRAAEIESSQQLRGKQTVPRVTVSDPVSGLITRLPTGIDLGVKTERTRAEGGPPGRCMSTTSDTHGLALSQAAKFWSLAFTATI